MQHTVKVISGYCMPPILLLKIIIIIYAMVRSSGAREDFEHIQLVKILIILNPTGYMLTSFNFAFFI